MPVLQLDDQQFPLKAGATRIGAGSGADVVVPGYSDIPVEAILDLGVTPTLRRAEESAHVRVNGVLLGAEPTPLMHGDKIEVAGLELRFADDAKSGATQFVSASDIAIAGTKRTGAARATAASGGRLVSLVDGKEYLIADGGLVIGRDASCDVVVAQHEVSRRHAEILPGDEGYVVRDTSANGLYVNGERVQGSHKLVRADVLRVGGEEFRFYADVLAPVRAAPTGAPPAEPLWTAAPPMPASPPAYKEPVIAMSNMDILEMDLLPEAPASTPAVPQPVPGAPKSSSTAPRVSLPKQLQTPPSAPAATDPRPVLAVLESMNEGPGKGTKYELHSPLGHVGRGAHNDVRLSDESVSETHAKLQKREDGWYVVDMDSTNGTYAGGSRVNGERKLEGSPDLRFGGLKFRFAPSGAPATSTADTKGTRAIAAMSLPPDSVAPQPAGVPLPAEKARATVEGTSKGGGMPTWIWIVGGVVVGLIVAFFLLKGRA
jgi:pSer/pThr/pTyr-binding forkhead associated (FHA) protein